MDSINFSQTQPFNPLSILTGDGMVAILRKLDILSLLRFGMTCKGAPSLTSHMWKNLRAHPPFSVNYSFLTNEPENTQDQWSYILTYLLKENALLVSPVLFDIRKVNLKIIDWRDSLGRILEFESYSNCPTTPEGEADLAELKDKSLLTKSLFTKMESLIKKLNKRHERLTPLIQRFPLWGCYIENNLLFLKNETIFKVITIAKSNLDNYNKKYQFKKLQDITKDFKLIDESLTRESILPSLRHIRETKQKIAATDANSDTCEGGEMLIQGVFKMELAIIKSSWNKLQADRNSVLQPAIDFLKQAIEKKGTLAGLAIYHLPNNECLPFESKLSLAICAAQQKDYSSLYYLLFSYGKIEEERLEQLLLTQSPNEVFPPIEAKRASFRVMDMRKELPLPPSIDLLSLNELYDQILEKSDPDDIPIEMWHDRAYILFKLSEFDQAQHLYSKVIEEYEKQDEWNLDRFYAWIEMAHIKIHFNQFEEANALSTEVSKKLQSIKNRDILDPIKLNNSGLARIKKACNELTTLLEKRDNS